MQLLKKIIDEKKHYLYPIYCTTIFLSAFLLFYAQPLLSKFILPWFGGSAGVWTVCLLFFQTTLLLGYLYSFLTSKFLSPLKQAGVHLFLLFIALFSLPILPDFAWKPLASNQPIYQIILILTASVGLPLIILSATSPLMQNWLTRLAPDQSPYKLYALSNAGSFLALLAFPFILEPFLSLNTQSLFWSILFGLFGLCCFAAASYLANNHNLAVINEKIPRVRVPAKLMLYWLALSTSTVVLLLAITNKISEDLSVVSLLWILPLGLYLLSYIIVFHNFSNKNFFKKMVFILLVSLYVSCNIYIFFPSVIWQILAYLFILFIFCLIIHRELYETKPQPEHLTIFYLLTACGGVLGGILAGVIAPQIFTSFYELPLIIFGCLILSLYIFITKENLKFELLNGLSNIYTKFFKKNILLFICCILLTICFLLINLTYVYISAIDKFDNELVLHASRNFYGPLKIIEEINGSGDKLISLISGSTAHGIQYSNQPVNTGTSYFGKNSGVGLIFTQIYPTQNLRTGIIGLGAGTIAAYGKKGDYLKFYEINDDVRTLANKYFTYLHDSPAQIDITIGDARISLEKEEPQNFDILVLDAFSSDAIPLHLLTKEAVEIYLKHLKSDGIIAAHITNRHLNLKPVLLKLADYFGLNSIVVTDPGDIANYSYSSVWVLLSRSNILDQLNTYNEEAAYYNLSNYSLWTDNYSNIFRYIK